MWIKKQVAKRGRIYRTKITLISPLTSALLLPNEHGIRELLFTHILVVDYVVDTPHSYRDSKYAPQRIQLAFQTQVDSWKMLLHLHLQTNHNNHKADCKQKQHNALDQRGHSIPVILEIPLHIE